jgi:antitoxin VapB
MSASRAVRQVRLFKNGRSQAVRIPREFELPGNEALLWRDNSGRLIIAPKPHPKLIDLLAIWGPLDKRDHLPVIDDAPAEPVGF